MADFTLLTGSAPLLVSLPHDGVEIPAEIAESMRPEAIRVPDTDWHVARLYEFAHGLGASVLVPRWSRYVIDLNRPPDGAPLYPGKAETSLCPTQSFAGGPLYKAGAEPDAAEIAARRQRYWQPYHDALSAELDRLHSRYPRVLLWEGHSIRSRVPRLFDGVLPDLNLGSADGLSCGMRVQGAIARVLAAQGTYSFVINGRFKGGYITRHYGQPDQGVHALQLELAQHTYMDEDTFVWNAARAARLQAVLGALLDAGLAAVQ